MTSNKCELHRSTLSFTSRPGENVSLVRAGASPLSLRCIFLPMPALDCCRSGQRSFALRSGMCFLLTAVQCANLHFTARPRRTPRRSLKQIKPPGPLSSFYLLACVCLCVSCYQPSSGGGRVSRSRGRREPPPCSALSSPRETPPGPFAPPRRRSRGLLQERKERQEI